jgi:outer membrane lipoprotein carrier protein
VSVARLRIPSAVLGCALALWALPVAAAPLEAGDVVQGLQGWLDGTRTLQGRFEQTLLSGALGSDMTESGVLYIERPRRMRWDYMRPERKIALVSDRKTSLYIEEDRQLLLGRLDEGGELLPSLLTEEGRIVELFDATLVAEGQDPGGETYRLRLVPRSEEASVEEVVLGLARDFAIEEAEVVDAAGNRVAYRFTRLKRNKRLPEAIFEFNPPPDTDVAGSHAPEEPEAGTGPPG